MNRPKFPMRFLRTKSNSIHSEATARYFLRKSIFCIIDKTSKLAISKIIKSKQVSSSDYEDLLAS
ncbi:MAG: hypothetical protein N4A57_14365 [Anaeromicrobium sp.]|nr:hypothetical protein [Anaeromicrobium sp.]